MRYTSSPFYFIFRTCAGHYIFQFKALELLIAFHLGVVEIATFINCLTFFASFWNVWPLSHVMFCNVICSSLHVFNAFNYEVAAFYHLRSVRHSCSTINIYNWIFEIPSPFRWHINERPFSFIFPHSHNFTVAGRNSAAQSHFWGHKSNYS